LKVTHPSSERRLTVSDENKVAENREEPKDDDVQGHRLVQENVQEEPDVEGHVQEMVQERVQE
jgi:hypothetical protein